MTMKYWTALSLIVILLIYIALSVYQLNLPGLHYDEAFEAVPAMQLLYGQPVNSFRNNGLTLAGRLFPLMTQDYIGAINSYAAIPFILIFGTTTASLRLMSITIGAITLLLTYSLTRQLTDNSWAGIIATLLLSVDPTFIFWNRQGIFVTAVTATIGLGATICWLRRFQGGSRGWSAGGAFLFGLGLYAKLLFIWLIAALVGATILLNLPYLLKERAKLVKKIEIWEVIITASTFLLGCWPLILYNIQTGGTFLNVTQNMQTSYYKVDNSAFVSNLLERGRQFITMLNGGHLWYLGDIIQNPLPAISISIVFVWIIIITIQNRRIAALFPFLVMGFVILFSIQTVSALWVTHFAILMPWPTIAIITGGWFIFSNQKQPTVRAVMWLGVCLLLGANLVSTVSYHQALAESGGLSTHSDAIYDLNRWLSDHPKSTIVAMDWGLAAPITYLTAGRVTPVEVFGYSWESDEELTARLKKFIDQPDNLYLWRSPDETIFDRSKEFKSLYRPLYLEEAIEEAFYERSGRPILGITRLVKCGTPGIQAPEPAAHCP